MTLETKAAAAKILAAIAAGRYRFAPVLDPATGVAAWPPGFRPQPWKPAYKITPAQQAAMATNLARGRVVVNDLQHAAGPLSKRSAFTGD